MIKLTMAEKKKIEVIQLVMDGKLKVNEASKVLGRTVRTIYRLLVRVRKRGIDGIIHGNRENKHAKIYKDGVREKILKLVRGKYQDINDTHLVELLVKNEGITVSRQWLRLLLRASNIKPKRKRRSPKYRSRRERKEAFGMMIQIDASDHDWLEGRSPKMVLVGGIDDATGFVWAYFEDSESTWSYLRLMRQITLSHGIPLSLYSDRHTIFHSPKEPTIIEQIQNIRPLTQFGRAMKELCVELIPAYSAPAKGRIEKLWNTLQDRLIVEMRLQDIKTKDEANTFLKEFLKDFNQRFTVSARKKERVFRKRLPLRELDRFLCLKETRVVQKNHTVSFEGLVLQIPPSSKWASIARQRVNVLQLGDGSIEIMYKNMVVAKFGSAAILRLIKRHQLNSSQLKDVA
ncbi:ISNCY family transposase [bacterium]|nr:ISNCY family transposase [bacterium]